MSAEAGIVNIIKQWLKSLGLSEYAEAFGSDAIDFEALSDIEEGDREKLGILMGDRKRMLRAIRDEQDAP